LNIFDNLGRTYFRHLFFRVDFLSDFQPRNDGLLEVDLLSDATLVAFRELLCDEVVELEVDR
jgi:hypothetical protein